MNPNKHLKEGCPRVIQTLFIVQHNRYKILVVGDSQSRMKLRTMSHDGDGDGDGEEEKRRRREEKKKKERKGSCGVWEENLGS